MPTPGWLLALSIWEMPCTIPTPRPIGPSGYPAGNGGGGAADNNAYWDQFRDNIVEKVSDTVYDAALKSYGDANGMRSYSMVVELLVAYYRNIV